MHNSPHKLWPCYQICPSLLFPHSHGRPATLGFRFEIHILQTLPQRSLSFSTFGGLLLYFPGSLISLSVCACLLNFLSCDPAVYPLSLPRGPFPSLAIPGCEVTFYLVPHRRWPFPLPRSCRCCWCFSLQVHKRNKLE